MTCSIPCVDLDGLAEIVAGSHRIGSLLEEVDGSSSMAVVKLVEIIALHSASEGLETLREVLVHSSEHYLDKDKGALLSTYCISCSSCSG